MDKLNDQIIMVLLHCPEFTKLDIKLCKRINYLFICHLIMLTKNFLNIKKNDILQQIQHST